MREGCAGGGRGRGALPGWWDPSPKSHLPTARLPRSARAGRQPGTLPLAQVPGLSPKWCFPSPELPRRCQRV